MRRSVVQFVLGALVLLAGVLLLLETTGIVPSQPVLWTVVLAGAGATFGYVFVADRAAWWAAIPSAALFGAMLARLMELDADGLGQWTEVPMLAALGIGFVAVYLRDRRHWWALIPGGMLLTLAVLAAVATIVDGTIAGAIFLFGAAITFALVAALPGGEKARWWAYIPAGILAVVGVAVSLTAADWLTALNVVWPSAVIVAGAFLIWRAVRSRQGPNRRSPSADESPTAQVNP